MPRPASLSLAVPPISTMVPVDQKTPDAVTSGISSPSSAGPGSSERRAKPPSRGIQSASANITSLPPFPASPTGPQRSGRDAPRNFFSNLKASRSSNKIQSALEGTIRKVSDDPPSDTAENASNKSGSLYSLRRAPGSTPDLSLSALDISSSEEKRGGRYSKPMSRRPVVKIADSDSAISHGSSESTYNKKSRARFGNLINRSRSTRVDDSETPRPYQPSAANQSVTLLDAAEEVQENEDMRPPPSTSAIRPIPMASSDRSLRDAVNRNRSADRESSNHSSENVAPRRFGPANLTAHSQSGLSSSASGMFKEGASSHLFTNLKNTSTKAADGLGRAGKGFLGKMNRKDSNTTDKEMPYMVRVINLPLVEQTRKTRIAARLEDSKDKTEFWMPALPWRCIDYLNFRGCEEEGLYRVPGSDKEIRHWQKRFDKEGDINLFHESDLYDINIIGSMFKAWLRELPTEILPKDVQIRIARDCADAANSSTVPQLFKDELSNLPPWNYYLLFAITCHLSLLTAYSDKNKMTYSNLCICFQPALRIDPFCFHFLVQQWRDCWQGCYTEKDALLDEYRVLDGLASSSSNSSAESDAIMDEKVGSTPSSLPPKASKSSQSRLPPLTTASGKSSSSTPVTPLNRPQQSSSKVPELTPVQPLSPIGDF